MQLSGVVVHELLLLALQDEPRGSSAPAGRTMSHLEQLAVQIHLRSVRAGCARVPCTQAGLAQSSHRN